ncbi:hypothetical protein [Nocardia xishanensis]|nr:hypothetical protein [Nocardia xishanensis]
MVIVTAILAALGLARRPVPALSAAVALLGLGLGVALTASALAEC